jgi:hypothetical protein
MSQAAWKKNLCKCQKNVASKQFKFNIAKEEEEKEEVEEGEEKEVEKKEEEKKKK